MERRITINTNGVLKPRVATAYKVLDKRDFIGRYVMIEYPSLYEIYTDFASYMMYYGIHNRDKVDLLSIYKTDVVPYTSLYLDENDEKFKNINKIILNTLEALNGDLGSDVKTVNNLYTEIENMWFPNSRIHAVLERSGNMYNIISHDTDDYGYKALCEWLISNNIIDNVSRKEEHRCNCVECNCDDTKHLNLSGKFVDADTVFKSFYDLDDAIQDVYGLGLTWGREMCIYANSFGTIIAIKKVRVIDGSIKLETIENVDKPLSKFTNISSEKEDMMKQEISSLLDVYTIDELRAKLENNIFMWVI